jgi:hypothetical protein
MARKVIGPTGSRRRRWLLLVCLVVAAGAAVVFIPGAFANPVTGETFELDGNIAQTHPNAPTTYDWANFFDANGSKLTLPTGYTASSFTRDFNTTTGRKGTLVFDTSDSSTFTIGSKDILDVNGWSCTPANNVTDKGDIMNAYATAYTDPNSGHKFLFFGLERNANAGDANVAFWFLQGSASCPAAGGSFTGSHHNGDLLIVSAFTNGGSVSTIDEYEWQNGALNTTPVAHGQDCTSGSANNDPTCATSNTQALSNIPWLTENKADGVGHSLQTGEFFEGGIDLSAPSVNLANNCFNTFIPDTRSSQSLTATLYDFAIGQLGECTSTTSTLPVDATDTSQPPGTSIPLDPNDAAVTVKDKTTVGVTGISSFNSTNSNNLSWHICGPTASNSTQLCDGTTGNVGVAVGSTSITAGGIYYSPTVTLTEAGRYCFRAEFAGDSSVGVPPSSDSSAGECFTIAPVQPSLTTAATTGPVDFGQSISDSVTLSGTAHEPGTGGPTGSDGSINPTTLGGDATGNIVVTAYGPDSCTTSAFTSSAIAASGDGTYGGAGTAFEFTPTAPGQYVFVASYAGDLPNTKAIAASACSDAPSSEKVTVRQIPTSLITKQSWYPNDTATITSSVSGDNLGANGTVVFTLYDTATCSGNVLYKQTITGVGGAHSVEVGTSNPGGGDTGTTSYKEATAYADAADSTVGPYSWKVVYTPAAADTAHLGRQSSCTAAGPNNSPPASIEKHSITYTNDNSGGTQP